MKKTLVAGLAIGLMIVGMAGAASAAIVDFTGINNSSGGSFSVGDVTFADSIGNNLFTDQYYESNNSQALGVFSDDASRLQLSFTGYYNYLSFDFGNDNPGYGNPNGKMHLDLYKDGALVQSFAMTANWDDLMNQTLVGTGLYNYAEIYYDTNLIEVIDNIEYKLTGAPVPEPATMLLFGAGIAGLAAVGRRKRS